MAGQGLRGDGGSRDATAGWGSRDGIMQIAGLEARRRTDEAAADEAGQAETRNEAAPERRCKGRQRGHRGLQRQHRSGGGVA